MKTVVSLMLISMVLTMVSSYCMFAEFPAGSNECIFVQHTKESNTHIPKGEQQKVGDTCCTCRIGPDTSLALSCCAPAGPCNGA